MMKGSLKMLVLCELLDFYVFLGEFLFLIVVTLFEFSVVLSVLLSEV